MTKLLAKTSTGVTLVGLSGDFLDGYKYRIIEYDNRVRDWNNRRLLDIKCFLNDNAEASELDHMDIEEFVAKYKLGNESKNEEKIVSESKNEEKLVSESKNEDKIEDKPEDRKRKKSRR